MDVGKNLQIITDEYDAAAAVTPVITAVDQHKPVS